MSASTASIDSFNAHTMIAAASAITYRNSANISQYDATGDAKTGIPVQTAGASLSDIHSQRAPA